MRIEGNDYKAISPPFAGSVSISASRVSGTVGPHPDVPAGPIIGVFRSIPAINTQTADVLIAEFTLSRAVYLTVGGLCVLRARARDGQTYDIETIILDSGVGDPSYRINESTAMWLDYPTVAVASTVDVPIGCSHIWYHRGTSAGTLELNYLNGEVRTIMPNLGYGIPCGSAVSVTARGQAASVLFQITL